ncbi:MAG: arylesterase [Planctomycetota bacterium]|nr:arylesterase [Planctomycetota bacterium]
MRIWIPALFALAACAPGEKADPGLRGEIGDRARAVIDDATSTRPTPTIPADAPVVVFLGDSIAAGLHLPANQAFPAVLQADLAARGIPFRLVNAGVSGDTSAGGLARIDWILKQQTPAVVVVELGGNDGLRGQELASIEANLRAIITQCRDAGAKVLLLGMRIPPSYGKEYSDGFAALYNRLANEMSIAFAPHFMDRVGGVADLTLPDGLHPTARGHELLAENVAPKLTEVLKR